jgi:DNA-directed RNA polymerase specialized sigma24 family protein
MTTPAADPEAVDLVERFSETLDPTDAAIFRRTVLDRATPEVIAAELGVSAEAVQVRCEALYGDLMAALAGAERWDAER